MQKIVTVVLLCYLIVTAQPITRNTTLHKDLLNSYKVHITLPRGSHVYPMIEDTTDSQINWSMLDSVRLSDETIFSYPERRYTYKVPAGSVVWGFKNSVLKIRLGSTMQIKKKHTLGKGSIIELRPDGTIGYLIIKGFAIVNGLPIHEIDNNFIRFNNSNYAPLLTTVHDTTISGILYPGRYRYAFNNAGRMLSKTPITQGNRSATQQLLIDQKWLYIKLQKYYKTLLLSPVTNSFTSVVTDSVQLIRGMPIDKGVTITYYPTGEIYGISHLHQVSKAKDSFRKLPVYSQKAYKRENFPIPYEITFYKSGALRTLVTNGSYTIDGLELKSFLLPGLIVGEKESVPSILYLDKDGSVLAGMNGEKAEIMERKIAPLHYFTIDKEGVLSLWPELLSTKYLTKEDK